MIRSNLKRSPLYLALAPAIAFSAASYGAIEEIVVTAQKREQSLQDTPISISAFSSDDIEKMDITDVQSVSAISPNLFINVSQGDTTTAVLSMRGANNPNGTNLGNENTVGIYFDGVYIAKGTAAIFDLADIERIEVLRGPQGTLYGKNTIGGAINIISGQPTGEFGGSAKIGFGSDSLVYSKLNLNLPSVGTVGEGLGELSSKITYVTRQRDGLVQNRPLNGISTGTTKDFSEIDTQSGRIALSLDVTDNLAIDYAYDWGRIRNTVPFFATTETVFPASFGLPAYVEPNEPTVGSSEVDNRDYADLQGNGLTVEWSINDNLTVKSISSYRDIDTDAQSDLDGSNLPFFWIIREVDYTQISQEFQVLGDYDNFKWIAGYYYFEENGTYDSPRPSGGIIRRTWTEIDNTLDAFFGQVDWTPEALPDVTLSLGVRYSEEEKQTDRSSLDATCYKRTVLADIGSCPTYNPGATRYDIAFTELPELSYDDTSFMASVTWNATDDLTLYGRYAEGYRGGGYDGQTSSNRTYADPYETEELTAYELGFKSQMLDNRVQLNGSFFLSDYDNLQITVYNNGISAIENAGKSEIRGVELEFLVQPTDDLRVGLNYGYLDPEYDEYGYEGTNIANVAEFTQTPENTFSATVDYSIPVENGSVDFHLDYAWTDDYYTQPQDTFGNKDEESFVEDYGVLNGRISLTGIALGGGLEDMTLTFWGKNILNEEYIVTNIPFRTSTPTPGWIGAQWGDPASFGVEASIRF